MKFTKGHNYVKIKVDYFTFLCTLSDELYICTKFQENISKGFRIERTHAEIYKGHNSIKNMWLKYLLWAHCLIMLYI